MLSSGPDWTDGTGSSNYSGCTLFCGMNTKCLNFADNFIELSGAYLLPGRPWDERLSSYYGCRRAHMMRCGQSYTHRWGGEWSAGLHLLEVGTKRPLVIDYVENWRKSLSRMDSSLQALPSPHFNPHLCTSGHRSPEMGGQSVQGQVKVLTAAVPPQDHTPLLALEPFSGGVTSSVGWHDRPGV